MENPELPVIRTSTLWTLPQQALSLKPTRDSKAVLDPIPFGECFSPWIHLMFLPALFPPTEKIPTYGHAYDHKSFERRPFHTNNVANISVFATNCKRIQPPSGRDYASPSARSSNLFISLTKNWGKKSAQSPQPKYWGTMPPFFDRLLCMYFLILPCNALISVHIVKVSKISPPFPTRALLQDCSTRSKADRLDSTSPESAKLSRGDFAAVWAFQRVNEDICKHAERRQMGPLGMNFSVKFLDSP